MKLLHWMHRKFRQNNGDVFKDSPTGPTCTCFGPSLDDHRQLSPVRLPAMVLGRPVRDRHMSGDDETLLFEGLLSIGTMGCGGPIEEAEEEEQEAMMVAAVEAITEKGETEAATETELMVVGAELEKVLAEAAEREGDGRLSSARPSHVSRGAPGEACPLQEFLLGSAAAAATSEDGKERKETKRASLGELFMIEEGGEKKSENEIKKKRRTKGEDDKGPVNVMMKVLKRHGPHGRTRMSDNGDGGDGGAATLPASADADAKDPTRNAKFQKILQIFHRKIHPENEAACKKPAARSSKHGSKYINHSCRGSNRSPAGSDDGDSLTSAPWMRTCGMGNKCGLGKPPPSDDGSSDSSSTREHWIKTDADYLVLEL